MFQELVLTGVSVRQMPTFGPTRSLLSHEVATSVDDIVIAHDVSFDKIAPDSHTLILCEYFCACLVICLVIWLQ